MNILIILIIKILVIYKYLINLRVCLCTLGKIENNYAIEFVEHYKKYGVDKIFIYDNNELKGERFDNILFEYIKNNFVEIIDYRGKSKIQLDILNHCYKNNYKKYDWFIFYDMDEFIFIKYHKNIKLFLKNKKFYGCKVIFLNELLHLDNNQILYNNKSLFKRFKEIQVNPKVSMVKPILRGNIENLSISNNHVIKINMKGCNGFGKKLLIKNNIHIYEPDRKYFYFDHFYFKSAEEYLTKLRRGSCFWGNLRGINLQWINRYFKFNKITLDKINYFENKTSLNLSIYRNKLKKNYKFKFKK